MTTVYNIDGTPVTSIAANTTAPATSKPAADCNCDQKQQPAIIFIDMSRFMASVLFFWLLIFFVRKFFA